MAKGKKTRLHLSSYAIDPERIEREANEMAKEGWLLEKFGSLCSTYRRGEPNEYEYRVQATKKKEMERLQYIKGLRELGIEHVGTVGEYLILRKKKDGTPFELYSDLDSLMAQIKRVRRVLWSGAVMCPFIAFAEIVPLIGRLYRRFQTGGYAEPVIYIPAIALMVLLLIGLCICDAQCIRALCRTREKLKKLEAERVVQE